jgi:plasmid stability protein
MSNLIVRNLDESLVRKLKQRAATHARSAEAEHRAILEAALAPTRRKSLAAVLASMPDVGNDADFARVRSGKRSPRVFD